MLVTCYPGGEQSNPLDSRIFSLHTACSSLDAMPSFPELYLFYVNQGHLLADMMLPHGLHKALV
jgi:hypothetical protein